MNTDWRFVLADAERICKAGSGKHTYSKDDYGRAMLDLAKAEASANETTAAALSRLWGNKDQRIEMLYKASESAPLIGRTAARAMAATLLDDHVRKNQDSGETFEQAYDRLSRTDAHFRGMYDLYTKVRA